MWKINFVLHSNTDCFFTLDLRNEERGEIKMNEQEIFEELKPIIIEQLGVEEDNVKTEATFVDDLSADSLDIVELIMAIEEKFDMEIPDSAAEKIVTVGDVVEYIKNNQ